MDPEADRRFAMNERRKEQLEPIIKELNPKAYETTV